MRQITCQPVNSQQKQFTSKRVDKLLDVMTAANKTNNLSTSQQSTRQLKQTCELKTRHQVVIAVGSHLFPFRTEKLSPLAPMVLQCNAGE